MAFAGEIKILPQDVYTVVLTNKIDSGQVIILDQEIEPTEYLVAVVDFGDPVPDPSYEGGVIFYPDFNPAFDPLLDTAKDFYVMPKNSNGKVIVYE